MTLRCFVPGIPVAKGSTRAFVRNGRAYITSTAGRRLVAWERAIAQAVALARPKGWPLEAAYTVECDFYLSRPRRPKNERPTSRPDADKLLRAALDAGTGVLWRDDSRVVDARAVKRYADDSGERPLGLYLAVSTC